MYIRFPVFNFFFNWDDQCLTKHIIIFMNLNNLTKRDWIFILIIISLMQGIIWYISFVNSKSVNALNYVSFAGTLISIILAVLAIGYTYGESLAEKNKSNNISNQINTLNDVIKNIQIEASALEKISIINS